MSGSVCISTPCTNALGQRIIAESVEQQSDEWNGGAVSLPDWLNPALSAYSDALIEVQSTYPACPVLRVYSQVLSAGTVSLGANLASGAISN